VAYEVFYPYLGFYWSSQIIGDSITDSPSISDQLYLPTIRTRVYELILRANLANQNVNMHLLANHDKVTGYSKFDQYSEFGVVFGKQSHAMICNRAINHRENKESSNLMHIYVRSMDGNKDSKSSYMRSTVVPILFASMDCLDRERQL
jgi:hypothetical protein